MSIQGAIYSRLSNYASLTALVGTKIRPGQAHDTDQAPYLTYSLIAAVRESAMVRDTGIVRASFQFSAFSASHEQAISIINEVRLALQRFSGTVAGVVIQQVFLENESFIVYEIDTKLYHRIIDAEIIYEE